MNESMNEFFSLLADFRRVQAVAFKGAVLVPLACIWTKIGPPNSGLTDTLLSLLLLVTLICLFLFFLRSQKVTRERCTLLFGVLFFLTAGGSVYLAQHYTVPIAGGGDRVVIGTVVQPDIAKLLSPVYTSFDALRDSEYDAEKVWTPASVLRIRLLYEADWVMTLVLFTGTITVFVLSQTSPNPLDPA